MLIIPDGIFANHRLTSSLCSSGCLANLEDGQADVVRYRCAGSPVSWILEPFLVTQSFVLDAVVRSFYLVTIQFPSVVISSTYAHHSGWNYCQGQAIGMLKGVE